MAIYINGTGNISPQKTIDNALFLETIEPMAGNHFRCIEPDYKDFIDPILRRRMSRLVKMGVASAQMCLNDADKKQLDAIVTGTGYGCLEDTENFIASVVKNDEKLLTPTAFIQSTYNTVSGQIALLQKCHQYNFTYVHRGFSFESALLDSMMLIKDAEAKNILLGGTDEITSSFFAATNRLGFWKKEKENLLNSSTKGAFAGEGSTFFLLSDEKNEKTYAEIKGLTTFYKPSNKLEIKQKIEKLLSDSLLNLTDIDLVIFGINGDLATDQIYYQLEKDLFKEKTCAFYKHLCGEYPTSTAFAMWLANKILKKQQVPDAILMQKQATLPIKNILIYNHFLGIDHSAFILSKC